MLRLPGTSTWETSFHVFYAETQHSKWPRGRSVFGGGNERYRVPGHERRSGGGVVSRALLFVWPGWELEVLDSVRIRMKSEDEGPHLGED